MTALQTEAQRATPFARLLEAALRRLPKPKRPRRRWHDERERLAFLADAEARRTNGVFLLGNRAHKVF